MKKLITIAIISLFTLTLTTYGAELKIEPVYGVERTYHATPEPGRYKSEIFAGVRGVYGTPSIAAEAELNQSNSSFTVGGVETDTTTQKFLLGMRLIPLRGKWFSLYFRTGVRAQKQTRETTESGVTTTDDDDEISYDPYAGTGFSINLVGLLSLNASATLVHNKYAEESEKYDTRYTFSASFKFGSK